jgi:septum formation protein
MHVGFLNANVLKFLHARFEASCFKLPFQPRRRELLTLTGWTFSVSPADIDETPRPGENSFDYVSRLSREKAHACPEKTADIVLAADTIVVDGEELLGKPEYRSDAFRMLRKLRGHKHRVMTAIVIFDRKQAK